MFVDVSGETAIGKWTHLAFTYDNISGVQAVYTNGRLKKLNDRDDNVDIAINSDPIIISDPGVSFPGLIDEVRIYNQALTQAQIQKHYTEGLDRLELADK